MTATNDGVRNTEQAVNRFVDARGFPAYIYIFLLWALRRRKAVEDNSPLRTLTFLRLPACLPAYDVSCAAAAPVS